MTNDRDEDKLAQLVDGVLSGLPPRCAPAGLERRVLAELARRAALPWWRRGFAQWPALARTGFVIVCVLLAGLSLTSGFTLVGAQTLTLARPFLGVVATIGSTAGLVASLIPPAWMYLAVGVAALLYGLLFGLGVFAYRTLYLQHSNTAMSRS